MIAPVSAMSRFAERPTRWSGVVLGLCALSACGSTDGLGRRLATAVTPYRIEVVQGNFVSREQVEQLKPGMSRTQVRELLGTPLVTSLFHADRWEYVFTLRRQGLEVQTRRLSVVFKGESLDRFEGDEMPAEAEFVAHLDSRRKGDRIPVLEASEETLRKAGGPAESPRADASPAPAAVAEAPAAPASYPPLEAPTR